MDDRKKNIRNWFILFWVLNLVLLCIDKRVEGGISVAYFAVNLGIFVWYSVIEIIEFIEEKVGR